MHPYTSTGELSQSNAVPPTARQPSHQCAASVAAVGVTSAQQRCPRSPSPRRAVEREVPSPCAVLSASSTDLAPAVISSASFVPTYSDTLRSAAGASLAHHPWSREWAASTSSARTNGSDAALTLKSARFRYLSVFNYVRILELVMYVILAAPQERERARLWRAAG